MFLFAYFKVGGVWRREKIRREVEILNKKKTVIRNGFLREVVEVGLNN